MKKTLCLQLLTINLLVSGCSEAPPPSGTVKGSVALAGKPYSDAAVVFLDLTSGQAASCNISSDGTYAIETPLWVGSYQVYLAPKLEENLEQAEAVPVKIDQSVPSKYWNESSTDLVCKIDEGENTYDVELKKK